MAGRPFCFLYGGIPHLTHCKNSFYTIRPLVIGIHRSGLRSTGIKNSGCLLASRCFCIFYRHSGMRFRMGSPYTGEISRM